MIFCAAGDPGGSRALLPIIDELERRGRPCLVLDHGFLGRELRAGLRDRLVPDGEAEAALASARAFLFGSSATDERPLALARAAQALGRPVIHVLDNWSGYARRLDHDGRPPLVPDLYAVMDEEARQGALAEGLPSPCLRVTGHPGLAVLGHYARQRQGRSPRAGRRELGLPEGKKILAFVNEPLRQVLGADLSAPHHYGFTEDQVLALWAEALAPWAGEVYVAVLPHPKDDPEKLARRWRKIGGRLDGQVLRLEEERAILPVADAAAGMASILLYDAWLCGLPTLSLQPGVRAEAIRRLARLPDIFYADTVSAVAGAVSAWLAAAGSGRNFSPRPELAAHLEAASAVAGLIEELLERGK